SVFVLNTVGISKLKHSVFNVEILPNPFSGQTIITYQLQKTTKVSARIYDLSGKIITILGENKQIAGKHTFNLNAEDHSLKAGIYLLRIIADETLITKQIISLK